MPKLKDENKLSAIRDAALKLVIQTGFAGLKMADVAKEAGMATGTVYIYYADKNQLINDLYAVLKLEVAAILLNPAHQSEHFYETFRKMWLAYFTFCYEKPEKMLFIEQFCFSGIVAEKVISEAEKLFLPLNLFLADAQKQGLLKLVDVEITKAFVQGAIHEIVKILLKNKRPLESQELFICFDMAWNSVKN
jgi:AcrR family transcriptional regulator